MECMPSNGVGYLWRPLVFLDEVFGVWMGSVGIAQLLFDMMDDMVSLYGEIGVGGGNKWMVVGVLISS